MLTRRDFNKLAATAAPALAFAPSLLEAQKVAKIETTVRGVKLGLITGSINNLGAPRPAGAPGPGQGGPPPGFVPPAPLTVDEVIKRCLAVPAANIEYGGPAEGMPRLLDGVIGQPPAVLTDNYKKSRAEVRQWHMDAPLGPFEEARKKFDASGLNWFSGINTIARDCDEEEVDAIFKQMQAMGLHLFCTNQTRLEIAPTMAKYAKKYNIKPAFHTHDKSEDPEEVASPESLVKLINMSPMFVINLDIGHYTAGNEDAVAFIREHHDRITHIHVKDRKKNHGPNVAAGTGDTPIVQCLQLIRDKKYPIICLIEREYRDPDGGDSVMQTRAWMDYMKKALES